jgi:hypothetical protein
MNIPPIAENQKAEGQVNPISLTTSTPSLSWSYFDSDGDVQTQCQIQVGTSADGNDMWDSTVSTSATAATYAGAPLSTLPVYYWRVRVFDNYEWSSWLSGGIFRLVADTKPNKPTNLLPSARQTTENVTISAFVTDNNGDRMNVFFYDNKTKSEIGHVGADSGTTASMTWYGRTRGQTYGFFVIAQDINWMLWGDNSAQSFKVNMLPIADNLKAENKVKPENLTTSTPYLGWKYSDNNKDNQAKYWIQVGTSENANNMWDSGEVSSKDNSVKYAGSVLSSGVTYYWRVRVFDNYEWSSWRYENGTFKLKPNIKPNKPTNLLPSARQTTTSVAISCVVTDNDGDKMYVFFYDNKTKSLIGNVWADSGTTASVTWYGLVMGQTYGFFARAQDNNLAWGENSSAQLFKVKVNTLPKADNLKAENRVAPENLRTYTPLLSWSYFDNDNDSQAKYWIQVGTSENDNSMWDSGEVSSSAKSATYAGYPLSVNTMYYWRVKVFDNYNEASENWRYENGRFKIVNAKPNKPTNLLPSARQTVTNVTISCVVTDNDGDMTNVAFYDNSNKSIIGWDNNKENGATASVVWENRVRGKTYKFFARAQPLDNILVWSDNSSVQSFKVNTLPKADNLKAENKVKPENLRTSIPTLSWSYFDNDNDSQAKYWIQVGTSENANNMWDSGEVSSSAKSATYAGYPLSLDTMYYWRVKVYDNWEASENWRYENGTFKIVNAKPNKPDNLSPSGRQTYTTSVTISCVVTDNDGDMMNVAFYDNSNKSIIGWDNNTENGATASVDWIGLTTGRTYAFFARAQPLDNNLVWSDNSSVQSFKVNKLPIVENLKAENRLNPDNLTTLNPLLSWSYFDNDKDNQTQRQIQVGTDNTDPSYYNNMWDNTVPTSATAATYWGSNLENNTLYYWRVRVFDNYEWSDWSSWATFTLKL